MKHVFELFNDVMNLLLDGIDSLLNTVKNL
jgi:hypothetical protein